MTTRSTRDVPGVGKVRAVSYTFPGRRGMAQLNCYALYGEAAAAQPVFDAMADAVQFDPGSRLSDRRPGEGVVAPPAEGSAPGPWLMTAAALVAAVGLTGAVVFALVRRSRVRGRARVPARAAPPALRGTARNRKGGPA